MKDSKHSKATHAVQRFIEREHALDAERRRRRVQSYFIMSAARRRYIRIHIAMAAWDPEKAAEIFHEKFSPDHALSVAPLHGKVIHDYIDTDEIFEV